MTTFLAVYGAVLATVLGVFEAFRFVLDRPRLRVLPRLTVRVGGAAAMVEVVNRGRRPTTVTEVGFMVQAYYSVTAPDGQSHPVTRWLKLDGPPTVLAPGEMNVYVLDLWRGFPSLVHVDFRLRSYAKDLNGRFVWGPATAMLGLVARSKEKLPFPPDPKLVEPLPGAPFKPDPVYPRWKVWHNLGVRDPLPLERRLRRKRPRAWEVGGHAVQPSEIVTTPVDEEETPPQTDSSR